MADTSRGPFQILSSREVYKNRWIQVREDEVVRPGGARGIFGVVEMKAGSSVLALTSERDVYLVREFKYAISKDSLETMSGALEEEESPLDAAKRELREELGLEAGQWINLGRVDPFTTIVHSPNYMFLALDLRVTRQSPDEGEVLHVLKIPLQEAVEMVIRGEITHSASCVLILKAERYLLSEG